MSDLVPGAVIGGRFLLDRRIGEGGMGTVWAATHVVTRKPVALKMLKPERAADPLLRQRLLREARAACAVQHPNIVEIHDVLELDDGSPVMVMDLLRGESLGSRLDRETTLAPETVARILLPVVSAVGTAHAGGVVHRDLKPDNIFLADEGDGSTSVKVLDFGIAKVLATEGDAAATGGLTGTGAMLGTPYYMAPEQIFGERDIDHRADIWAIGVILYECLSGRRPTQGDNIGQILKIITTETIVPLERVAPGVPQDLAALVRRMLSRDRSARPQSLAEVQAALRRYTDAATRSFGDPAVRAERSSLVDSGEKSGRALVDSKDGANPLSQTKLETTSRRAAVRSSSSSGQVRIGSGEVSPEAATLASTTASTTADRMMATRSKSRTPWLVGAGVLAASLATVGVLELRGTSSAPRTDAVTPPAAAAPAPEATPSTALATPPASTAGAAAPSATTPVALVASSLPRVRPAVGPAAGHPTVSPRTITTATAATTAAPPPAPTAPPGGVVEKPPF